jgi:predicted AlkP superfamily phosphohydrolase/phosphomutase
MESRIGSRKSVLVAAFFLTVGLLLAFSPQVEAYAGPGAGFALVTSFLVVFAAVSMAMVYLAAWPLRLLWRSVRGRRALSGARVPRVVVLGLDGLDPRLCQRFMKEGKLPNLESLHYEPLATTLPALSPVAWSTFQTGMDPSYHGLFDFLRPARPSYTAEMASVKIALPPRTLRFGKYRVPLGRPQLRLRRHGVPFWKYLGDAGIFSAVLRVPISFPPERFRGVSLSAMSVPDLRGTQGTFTFYSSEESTTGSSEGGVCVPVTVTGTGTKRRVEAELVGPPNPVVDGNPTLHVPFQVALGSARDQATLTVGGTRVKLVKGEHSEWVRVTFRPGLGIKIRGIVRFCLVETAPAFKLYASPLHFDPERPALPISHPRAYSVYLAKRFGAYATLGLAEDTWALNERVIDEDQFLDGTYRIHAERETMFFDALDKVRRGLVVCVFDASDRIQHMFMRTLDPDHPANRDKETEQYRDVLETMYRRMDDLVGRTRAALGPRDALLVISDHGFLSFKRGINLNAWLLEEGFLHMKTGAASGAWFDGVDWERTRAYALGLSGIYLNQKGRESEGIVDKEQVAQLKEEIGRKLEALRDPTAPDAKPVNRVFDAEEVYRGPYRDDAPDLLIGYGAGYRISWDGATGRSDGEVLEDNTKSWSGDHGVDPALVPGVLYSNVPITQTGAGLADMAPTVLDLFGVKIPPNMKGKALCKEPAGPEH